MAFVFIMMSRCFNSAPGLLLRTCVKNYPENVIRHSRNKSSRCFLTQPKYLNKCPSKSVPQSCFGVDRKKFNLLCSSDISQYTKSFHICSNLKLKEDYVNSFNELKFRQFNSKNLGNPLLLANKDAIEYLKGLPKSFLFGRKSDGKKPKRRIPRLILLQNPFTWLMIKIDFSVLRHIWDPSFTEKEFKFGTKQAISRVTNVISEGQFTELNGLLTKAARLSLMRELDRNWSEKQRSLLSLNHEDIQISSPRKVYFIRIADKKYCDIDMAFLALKWAPINSIEALIFTEIFARFHREYTPHSIPEWTIAYFKVTRFEVLRKKLKTA